MNILTTDVQMTSLDIAEIVGKRHDNIMRDVRKEVKELGEEIDALIFEEITYKDKSRSSPAVKVQHIHQWMVRKWT